ncbi:RagB/SusD family nutrient uptake outer membrane protein [Pedobacter alluvionis]|uniref:Putative outer membrane starch-binding protein n=1 Tax=Pedobacter alluvionis TaxID=475253 RepID=A0A497XXU8_9SPHI|nr:RagB/SusD family nutrient uptake outer membrane protein [Pedobacter alluvionis]RLJ73782.1 putative outer membrane starch-binding protein [Pedobacter alluvionis]TFB32605.1 RagB/SusD family nutrient uptake outer membrane protein [Pedobacter alluvionis]
MKKITYILFFITFLAFISSCKKTLDAPTKSALDESVIFSTPGLAEGSIPGILQSFGETNSYRGRFLVYYGLNNDAEVYNGLKTIDDKSNLSNYDGNANNSQMNTLDNAWAKFYEGIERANLAIRGLRTYGNISSNPQMAQILGEILTLRAVLYNDLIKGWGDVPARFEPITTQTTYLERSDRDIIYKQLLADLNEAAGYLPWPGENAKTAKVERVSKAFAKGLRARLALSAGGYAQRLDGTVRLSTDPDLSRDKMYAIAKKECLDIIGSNKLRLLGFEEVFRKLNEEAGAAGLESMWEIPFSEGRGRVIFDLGVKHLKTDKYTGQNKGGTDGPNPIMLYEYDRDDVRKAVSIVPYEWDGGVGETGGYQVPSTLGRLYFGKYRYEWMKRRVTSTNDDGLNWMYMRYADVVLMAAEAINELDGPAAAAPYLKMIRDRAFPTNPTKVTTFMATATASKQAFFDAIVNERALEFTGEMLRKNDLIRWNLLGTKLAEAKTKLQQLETRQGKYAALPAKIYYRTAANGETVEIYGLNFGDTDAEGVALGYTSNKAWTMSATGDTQTYWDALYAKDPNKQQFWPIWQVFIDSSNGMLNNKNLGL